MQKIDPCDHDTSLEDVAVQQDNWFTQAGGIFVRGVEASS
jgi:hypothetical protein